MLSFNMVLLGPSGVFIVDLIPVKDFQYKIRNKSSFVVHTLTQLTTFLQSFYLLILGNRTYSVMRII